MSPVESAASYFSEHALELEPLESAAPKGMGGVSLDKFRIDPVTKQAMYSKGITELFPVQAQSFDTIYDGKDVIGRSRTGSGKTLAFCLPIIERMIQKDGRKPQLRGRPPRFLVVAPTRELAKQVEREAEWLGGAQRLATVCVYGGDSISRQIDSLTRGVDIVVGTPGRIIDLIERGALDLSHIEAMTLDEADEMLKMGFQDDVERIFDAAPKERQLLLFSATMPSWVHKLARNYCRSPVTLDMVGESKVKLPATIKHIAIYCAQPSRDLRSLIADVLAVHGANKRALIFCDRKASVEDTVAALRDRSPKVGALHGDMSQPLRERSLELFRRGSLDWIVATDVAARGLDIPEVELVVHTAVPDKSDSFVHRSGRTGRAGRNGTNVVIYSKADCGMLDNLAHELDITFTYSAPPGPDSVGVTVKDQMESVKAGSAAFFQKVAAETIAQYGAEDAVARLVALSLGYASKIPRSVSVISGRTGFKCVTVRVEPGIGSIRNGTSPVAVIKALETFFGKSINPKDIGEIMTDRDEFAIDLSDDLANEVLAAKLPKGVVSVSLTTRPIGRVDTYGGGDRGYGRDRGRSHGSFSRGGSNGRGSSRGGSYGRGSPNEYSGARRSSGGGPRSGESRSASADRSFLSEHGGRDWAGSEVRSYQESRSSHPSGRSSSNQTTASWQSEWDNMKFSSSR